VLMVLVVMLLAFFMSVLVMLLMLFLLSMLLLFLVLHWCVLLHELVDKRVFLGQSCLIGRNGLVG